MVVTTLTDGYETALASHPPKLRHSLTYSLMRDATVFSSDRGSQDLPLFPYFLPQPNSGARLTSGHASRSPHKLSVIYQLGDYTCQGRGECIPTDTHVSV